MRQLAFVLLLIASPAAADAKPPISGLYGDLTYNDEGGDLLGTEIRIVKSAEHYEAYVQTAEGTPGPVRRAAVTASGNHVHFTVAEKDGSHDEYDGRITSGGFDGTRTSVSPSRMVASPLRLPRLKKSYWQRAH